ncbi:MAG: Na+/H+ antiporter subunit E [Clostridia bacterium]|nr:Na+/H+ antiporter subunit E [Clostridia bacterium]
MYPILFGLWLILNGALTFEIVLFGIGITALLAAAAYALFGYSPKDDLRLLTRIPLFLAYTAVLLYGIIKANFTMLRIILSRDLSVKPALAVVDTGLSSRFTRFLFANSITLTPGTITVRTDGERFTVHCLRREMIEGIENGTLAKLLRKMEK